MFSSQQCSDVGVSAFRELVPLLLVHGRWAYVRSAGLVCLVIYKNFVLVLPIFFFGALSGYSAQKFYDEGLYQLYNVLLTVVSPKV